MTLRSLPALPLSRNDISSLAQLLQVAFNHFLSCNSSSEKGYLDGIKVVSDCYLLTLVENGLVSISDERLIKFKSCLNFKQNPDDLEKLSQLIAEMIYLVANKLQAHQFTWYHEQFAVAIRETIGSKISYIYGNLEEAQRLKQAILFER